MKLDRTIVVPSLGGLQYGYNTTIIAGAILFITPELLLTPFQEGILVAMALVGLCLASFAGILSNSIGRKKALLLSSIGFIAGPLLSALAPNYPLLLIGRFITGLGAGIAIVVCPLYLVEVAPPETRGRILNMNQIGIALGTLLAYGVSYLFASTQNWRMMFAVALLPALIQFPALFFLPETRDKKQCSVASWKAVLSPSFRSRFLMILALALFQSLCGSSALFFFAPRVFENVGFASAENSLLATVFLGLIYLSAIVVSFYAIDRLGRRFLLLFSLAGMALSLLTIIFFLFIDSPASDAVTLISVLAYIAFYSLGAGPVPPMVTGEISTMQARGHVMSLMGASGWVTNYFVTLTFLPLMNALGLQGAFSIYVLFCLIGFTFFFLKLPETKQKTFAEIESLFSKK